MLRAPRSAGSGGTLDTVTLPHKLSELELHRQRCPLPATEAARVSRRPSFWEEGSAEMRRPSSFVFTLQGPRRCWRTLCATGRPARAQGGRAPRNIEPEA